MGIWAREEDGKMVLIMMATMLEKIKIWVYFIIRLALVKTVKYQR
jgi:hypothetical protein